jgi:hypothetical protein
VPSKVSALLRSVRQNICRAGHRCRTQPDRGRAFQARCGSRQAYRCGTKLGYCLMDGQKVPVQRPRLRSKVPNARSCWLAKNDSRALLWGRTSGKISTRSYYSSTISRWCRSSVKPTGWRRAPSASTSSKRAPRSCTTDDAVAAPSFHLHDDDQRNDLSKN